MDASFRHRNVERDPFQIAMDALARYAKPEIFNTDQGSQFTGGAFTSTVIEAGVRASMDGRGRWQTSASHWPGDG